VNLPPGAAGAAFDNWISVHDMDIAGVPPTFSTLIIAGIVRGGGPFAMNMKCACFSVATLVASSADLAGLDSQS
jgi:hypothetical protein